MKISNSEIFISYAWGDKNEKGESREDIVNELYDSLTSKGFTVIRDKVSLGYGGRITDFMNKIGRGKYVVVVISDKYLKSEFCMYEILELVKNKDYSDRIFPIILSDANIFDEIHRLEYLDYWSAKKHSLQRRIRDLQELQDATGAHQKLKQYDDIREIIGEFTSFIKDVNALTPDMHSDSDFKELIKFLENKRKKDILFVPPSPKVENEEPEESKIISAIPKRKEVSNPKPTSSRSTEKITPSNISSHEEKESSSSKFSFGRIAAVIAFLFIGFFGILKMTGSGTNDGGPTLTGGSDDPRINVSPKGGSPGKIKNLAGKWKLTYIYENCNGSTGHRFVRGGLETFYEFEITQSGNTINGKGMKVSENYDGSSKKYTEGSFPAFIKGKIIDGKLEAEFNVLSTNSKETVNTINIDLAKKYFIFEGTFQTTASNCKGVAKLQLK